MWHLWKHQIIKSGGWSQRNLGLPLYKLLHSTDLSLEVGELAATEQNPHHVFLQVMIPIQAIQTRSVHELHLPRDPIWSNQLTKHLVQHKTLSIKNYSISASSITVFKTLYTLIMQEIFTTYNLMVYDIKTCNYVTGMFHCMRLMFLHLIFYWGFFLNSQFKATSF